MPIVAACRKSTLDEIVVSHDVVQLLLHGVREFLGSSRVRNGEHEWTHHEDNKHHHWHLN